jgi:hypothetical protein
MEQTAVWTPTDTSHRAASARVDTRLLGTLGMIGSPMLLADGLCRSAGYIRETQGAALAGALGVAYLIGILCSAVGLRRLRVTGRGPGAAALFAVQIAALLLAFAFSVAEALGYRPGSGPASALLFAADMGWPFSHVLMLLVGVAMGKAGVWRGWRRLPPFVCGAALPLFFAVRPLAEPVAMLVFPLMTAAGFLALGWTVRTGVGPEFRATITQ